MTRKPGAQRGYSRGRWAFGDLGRPETLGDVCEGVDTVFHLAGHAHAWSDFEEADKDTHGSLNEEATRALVNFAGQSGVRRFVFFSSVKAMGEGGERQLDESCDLEPKTAYGRAKLAAEKAVLAAGEQYGMQVCNLRLSLVYGPGVKGNLARMIEAIDRGRFPATPLMKNRRSMVDVRDVVQAALLAAGRTEANGQTYVVTDSRPYSTSDIYHAIRKALGKDAPRWLVPMSLLKALATAGDALGRVRGRRFMFDSDALEKLTGSAWYSSAKIGAELGYQPLYTLEQALPEMIDAYRRGINVVR